MFYSEIFSYADTQKLLRLKDLFLISTYVHKFMKDSTHVIKPKRMEVRGGSRVNGDTPMIPRVEAQRPLDLLTALIRGEMGMKQEALALLFELGLGVPQQKEVANFIRTYRHEDDANKGALKAIRKLVVNYQDQYEEHMGESDYFYPAPYVARLLDLNKFVTSGASTQRLKVPNGIPVVLVYKSTNHHVGEFSLVDAFNMSGGVAKPWAHIMLRREAKVPKKVTSKSMTKHTAYMLVFGMFCHQKEGLLEECQELDIDDYDILVSSNPECVSKEFAEFCKTCEDPAEQKQRLANESLKYARKLQLNSAEFVAIDAGMIDRYDVIRAVSASVKKTEKVLQHIGFNTQAKTVNHNKVITYSEGSRIWHIGG